MALSAFGEPNIVANSFFDPFIEPHTVGERWRVWVRNFQYYIDGIVGLSQKQKVARLLHQAGTKVQEIYENLQQENDTYDEVVAKLTQYFIPSVNVAYERQNFRALEMNISETIDQYVLRLRTASRYCSYENPEEVIRDQVIEKCKYDELKRKFLRKGGDLTLSKMQEIARIFELERSDLYMKKEEKTVSEENVNAVFKCFRCGGTGHLAKSNMCPALQTVCRRCNIKGHYSKLCKTKLPEKNEKKKKKKRMVRYVLQEESSESENSDEEENDVQSVFNVNMVNNNKCKIKLNGEQCEFIIDSGAAVNIIDKNTYERFQNRGLNFKLSKCGSKYCTYGGKELPNLGEFNCSIYCPDTNITIDYGTFLVFDGKGPCLLSKETSEKLQLLRVGPYVLTVGLNTIRDEYKDLFTGIGKLKNFKLKIHLDPKVPLVAQPVRRVPFNMREIEAKLINELLENDIIEPVSGPTPCVSPSHIVRKKEPGQHRLVVDMRRANEAVLRERVPLPTFEELLADLNGCKYFSALDIKWGFHQVELDEDSRMITVFSSSLGLYRYKRLFFGIRCAPEVFQRIVAQLFTGIDGVANSQDDIIIGGRTKEEHDERLIKVLKKLRESGITLNEKKCVFGVQQMTFLGHHLSADGIKPTRTSQDVIQEFRAPSNKEEIRSFLGLVNFSARFIPDYSTITEPLRILTKKDVEFKWEKEQQQAFQRLKDLIATAPALGFYDKQAETYLITDASPVGIAAVLVQHQIVKGQKQPVVIKYCSRALTDTEKRYSQTEKEALAIVWACENLYMYLIGKRFNIVSDHKPLETIYSNKSNAPSARIQRWVLRLQPYHFNVIYKPGKNNIADPLSRLLNSQDTSDEKQDIEDNDLIASICEGIGAVTVESVREETLKDSHLIILREAIRNDMWTKELKKYEVIKAELCEVDGVILRGSRLVIPKTLITKILDIGHEGHISIQGMKAKLRRNVWWLNMDKDIEYWVDTCEGCRLVRKQTPPEPITSTELPSKVWETVAVDYLGPLPSGHYLLVIIDYYSRYYEVEIVKGPTAENTIKILKVIIAREGVMDTLVCDNGPAFRDQGFKKFLDSYGIRLRHTTPLWPQANGEVERQNRSILRRLRVAQALGKDWKEELLVYLAAYRTTPHTTTGIPPGELFRGRKIRTKLPDIDRNEPFLDEEVRDRDRIKKQLSKEYADRKRCAEIPDLNPGDKVLVRQPKLNKLTTTFSPTEHTVLWKKGNSVVAESPDGKIIRRNSSHFQRVKARNPARFTQTEEKITDGEEEKGNGTQLDLTQNSQDLTYQPDVTNAPDLTTHKPDLTQTDKTYNDRPVDDNSALRQNDRARVKRQPRAPLKYKDFVMGLVMECIMDH